jgi:hypothetical protein
MLSTLTIISLDQGKMHGPKHVMDLPDDRLSAEVNTKPRANLIEDAVGTVSKGLLTWHATGLVYFLNLLAGPVVACKASWAEGSKQAGE